MRVGMTFAGRRRMLGVPVLWTGIVTEWQPPVAFAYRVRLLGAHSETRVTLEPIQGGTSVSRMGAREGRPVQRWIASAFRPLLRRHHDARIRKFERLFDDPDG